MWEPLSPSSWTLTFDQALIQSLVVVVERGGYVGTWEAPLSTHSQCFIYGPLHFWLWWLQYLSSYLNCIFKDFIQYLHAIRYELIFFFFANHFLFVSYLIVFIGHDLSLVSTNKHAHRIYFSRKMLWGMFPVCFCVSWFWWQLNTRKQVLENICWMS